MYDAGIPSMGLTSRSDCFLQRDVDFSLMTDGHLRLQAAAPLCD